MLANLSVYYVGSKVLLNTGEIGEVVYIPPQSITEPVVNIGDGFADLARRKGINIQSMI